MKLSLLVPFMPKDPRELVRWAALLEPSPGRLWQGQAVTLDPLQSFAYVAGAGHRVPVGLSVTLMPLKHPFQAAMEARSLAQITGHPVVYGLGPGPVVFQELLGARPASQLRAVREYVTAVRDLLAGDTSEPGETVTSSMPLHRLESPEVRLGLGVLRPAMARLAGEIADVAVTWLAPADYVGSVVEPALREGAESAGVTRPLISSVVPVALRRPGRNPYRTVLASNYGHLQGPHYQDMLAKAGIQFDIDRPGPAAKAVLDGGAFLHDDVDGLGERLGAYVEAGVDEVVLNLSGVHALEGPDAAYDEAAELLEALCPTAGATKVA
ncbi:LLM class flavin-dependent oxidoreductase [Kineosporia rhizophila]|uniref:LLM class flavin-dependent oxidoreductase n=1 Tax=Kineosporia TaxID=49184 RepID=UPI000B15DF09|nr:LLM class flavin-dependent oxidoreductase [Kineosporia sp. NBRC 101677]MCE0539281.1 LLM class flavin-dependent oxidoreductase [Kineosporia rhizophila]GLY14432.1 hypothetical protein Kisp01_14470 [Kineosporia sp. NBRC 101677]